MQKNSMNMVAPILTGAAVSMAVGTAAYMMSGKSARSRKRAMKKNATKVVRVVGDIAENLSHMVR